MTKLPRPFSFAKSWAPSPNSKSRPSSPSCARPASARGSRQASTAAGIASPRRSLKRRACQEASALSHQRPPPLIAGDRGRVGGGGACDEQGHPLRRGGRRPHDRVRGAAGSVARPSNGRSGSACLPCYCPGATAPLVKALQPSDWPPPGSARMTSLNRTQPKLRLTGAAHDQRAMRPRALIAVAIQTQMVL